MKLLNLSRRHFANDGKVKWDVDNNDGKYDNDSDNDSDDDDDDSNDNTM